MPAGVGYDAAMACDFGLLYVMKMIESAAGHVNFFWGGLRNSSNSLHPQCSILPRLMAQILCTNFASWPANGRSNPASPQDSLSCARCRRTFANACHRNSTQMPPSALTCIQHLGYSKLALRLRLQRQETTGAGDLGHGRERGFRHS